MLIEECLMEMVCHCRWLTNYLLTQIDPDHHTQYPRDIECARQTLTILSKSFSHIESIEEVPLSVVMTLCEGAVYLLVAESVLQKCPPTMHQFLQHTSLQREQSAAQAQLLVVRWLVMDGIISIDELIDVVFGGEKTLEDYESDYDAHADVAKHLAEPDPFFLGAHVTIARGLLLEYTTRFLNVDDVVSHVNLIAPQATAELHTLEDTLLFWLRTVIGLFAVDNDSRALVTELSHVDDLYLHTNDGRVLAVLMHHYNPDLLQTSSIHVSNPLTVWQRQNNWSNVIRAAESLNLWVGVFADEMVAHGFSTLQAHVLRFVEELFVVLASNVEQSYEAMQTHLQQQQQEAGGVTDISTVSTEMPAESMFVDANVSRSIMGLLASSHQHNVRKSVTVTPPPPPPPAEEEDENQNDHGSSAAAAAEMRNDAEDDNEEHGGPSPHEVDDDLEEVAREGEYNIVLTNLFLQGVSIPIRRQQLEPEAKAVPAVAVPPTPVEALEIDVKQPADVNPCDDEPLEGNLNPATTNKVSQLTGGQIPTLDGPIVCDDGPQRTDSPIVRVSRSFERRRQLREDNAVASSLAHFEQLRKKRTISDGHNNHNAMRLSAANHNMIVQGSMDTEGVEALLRELAAVTDAQAAVQNATGSGLVDPQQQLREQNQQLRWALEEQQRKVHDVIARLRQGIRKQEFTAIVKHLKSHRPNSNRDGLGSATGSGGVRELRHSFATLPPQEQGATSPARSTAGATAAAANSASVQSSTTALRRSLERVRSSQVLNKIPPGLVVRNVGASVQAEPSAPKPSEVPAMSPEPEVGGKNSRPSGKGAGGAVIDVSVTSLRAKPTPTSTLTKSRLASRAAGGPSAPPAHLALPNLDQLREQQQQQAASTAVAAATTAPKFPPRRTSSSAPSAPPDVPSLGASTNSAAAAPPAASFASIKLKSNKVAVANALKFVLLTGALNKANLQNSLKIVDDMTASTPEAQFLVLFKDEFTHQFKGLYALRPDSTAQRVFGAGPALVYIGPQPMTESEKAAMQGLSYYFPKFFKFDSGSKTFKGLPCKEANQTTDGFAFAANNKAMNAPERERW